MQIVMSLMLFWRHRSNIQNLMQGSEGTISNQESSEK
jgi:glycerol-3-phosphate acyltransferase PlsY